MKDSILVIITAGIILVLGFGAGFYKGQNGGLERVIEAEENRVEIRSRLTQMDKNFQLIEEFLNEQRGLNTQVTGTINQLGVAYKLYHGE